MFEGSIDVFPIVLVRGIFFNVGEIYCFISLMQMKWTSIFFPSILKFKYNVAHGEGTFRKLTLLANYKFLWWCIFCSLLHGIAKSSETYDGICTSVINELTPICWIFRCLFPKCLSFYWKHNVLQNNFEYLLCRANTQSLQLSIALFLSKHIFM